MGLTEKSQAEFEQLGALRNLAMHLGLIAPSLPLRPSHEEIHRRIEAYGLGYLLTGLFVLFSKNTTAVQKTAALAMVEVYWPDFTEVIDQETLGPLLERNDREVRAWRAAVLRRDEYRCTKCGSVDELHAHHIVRWVDAPHLRVVVENGVTLCRECHGKEHQKHAT